MKFISMNIYSPKWSHNTDGIHLGKSSGITIMRSLIGPGDDCVSLSPGSENISVYDVRCGPSHGISAGSFGRYDDEEPLKGIYLPPRVVINDMSLKKNRGTSRSKLAVKLFCNEDFYVEGWNLANINLQYIGSNGPVTSEC
ncbi:hypothetical protein GIB67_016186 [Kingdonia uniflora]|uniref:Polygalacturonase n=1 Tax=Kingdonia uniflora TaxID=39325 RepID=A0A7J7LT33_9MAGN|nr:hypothetical protein GIB67_016186 [Kingdonia uniflora]